MSNPTTPFSWQMPTATDLVTDLPADFEVFGQAVATSMADLLGGTSGQILAKNSNTDMDFVWVTNDVGDITAVTAGTGISGGGTSGAVTITNDMATTITASGDIVVGTGSGTYDNLPIGTTGQVLTTDTTVSPYKVKWATPATASFVGCAVNITTNQTLTNNATTVINYANEVFDTNGFHSNVTNPSRITIPTGYAGKYIVNGASIIGDKTTGRMIGVLSKNGSSILQTNWGNNSVQSGGEVNGVISLAEGDYITFGVYQGSGSDAATGTDGLYNRFSAIYLGA